MDDVTSLTKEEENKRQQIAKEKIHQSRKRQAESETHTETDQLRGLLPKASRKESVLDASIHQVFTRDNLMQVYIVYAETMYTESTLTKHHCGSMSTLVV